MWLGLSGGVFRNGLFCTARYRKRTVQAGTLVLGEQNLSLQGKVCLETHTGLRLAATYDCIDTSRYVGSEM